MERKVFYILAVLFGLVIIIGYCNRAEAITRDEFKTRVIANYQKMEGMAKADGCVETKRYWTHVENRHEVVLWVKCVATQKRYWLSTPDAHHKVQNAI